MKITITEEDKQEQEYLEKILNLEDFKLQLEIKKNFIIVHLLELFLNKPWEWFDSFVIKKMDRDKNFQTFVNCIFDNKDSPMSELFIKDYFRENDEVLKYTISEIISDLGFIGLVKKTFFPKSYGEIFFRDAVTKSDLLKENIDYKGLLKDLVLRDCKIYLLPKYRIHKMNLVNS